MTTEVEACREHWWQRWRAPHVWGIGTCTRCGRFKRCGQSDGGLLLAYYCTQPINHVGDHYQGDPEGAHARWPRV